MKSTSLNRHRNFCAVLGACAALAAFGIDAAWDQRNERALESAYVESLVADFQAAREGLTFMVALHPWRSLGALDVSEEYLKEFSDQLVSCVSDGNPYICRKAIEFPECERIGCTHKRH